MSRLIRYNNCNKNGLLNIYKTGVLSTSTTTKSQLFINSNNNNSNSNIIEVHKSRYCTLSTSTKPASEDKPNLIGTISNIFDKVKKKSFIIDNYFDQQPIHTYNHIETPLSIKLNNNVVEPLKILDPLNILGKKKSNELFKIVESDLSQVTRNILDTLSVGAGASSDYAPYLSKKTSPVLVSMSKYYFELKGKRIRPTIVLLLSKALSANVQKTQIKLAEVVEMIHTASLVHDDVIDEASTRRDVLSINQSYSNKLAILCGDFLLARASLILSTIRNSDVTECMSLALAELVEGEFMQAKSSGVSSFDHYLKKTYLKTGSLITNSCRSAAILSGADQNIVNISTEFGKNLGLAFQIIDDLLDYTGSAEQCGKAVSVDLNLGLATAPVLFATQEFPQLEDLIKRKFSKEGDVEEAKRLVAQSQGIEKTRNLAIEYVNLAIESLLKLPQSDSRDLLIALSHTVVTRTK
ncbi:hypothetical protein DICPUDRAFT_157686 [Dictyostelium purpureum]|uniref:Trans-prenyltransferase n=1 Tax=Dictyostelium purpureum TaxID=5786 RepID=F0ZZQ9_DICPU|nr:uncharacterized protein DICPUDRAFT_157686 [Dictyostelium purpureum]EGC30569.1 hypothetical protein DICPUDRAFT_157686 [Dictyostelium purpureum]|eukprot:XP_003292910.1 hypothetical protein DICPUDRAFT_157686 [Dictyostelium purpureum]